MVTQTDHIATSAKLDLFLAAQPAMELKKTAPHAPAHLQCLAISEDFSFIYNSLQIFTYVLIKPMNHNF